MAIKLRSIDNLTSSVAVLTNTEHDFDRTTIPASSLVSTGGKDGDYIRIPDCSDDEYFREHHILIKSQDGDWMVALWNNDDLDHMLYWSPSESYVEDYAFGNSTNKRGTNCALRIEKVDGKVKVTAAISR